MTNDDSNYIYHITNSYIVEPSVFNYLKTQVNRNSRLNYQMGFYKNKFYNSEKDVRNYKRKLEIEKDYSSELENRLKRRKTIILVTDESNKNDDDSYEDETKNGESDSDNDSVETILLEEEYVEEILYDYRKDINNINDIINLQDIYDKIKIDPGLKKLYKIIPSLHKLNNLIGLDKVKENIYQHILYALEYGTTHKDMLHTIITGPPGVGKTELGKIIGDIYRNLGILKKKTFKIVKRSDLIAGYLGQTAIKTQKVIDQCQGGILFIDEAYSLGNSEQRDSFSKECIDTINQNLTEKKTDFICIIAGYEEQLEKCFFNYNPGLRRRFTFKYKITKYTPEQLFKIFELKCKENNYNLIEINEILEVFIKNKDLFKYYGGDIEILIFYCKIYYSNLIFQGVIPDDTINFDIFQKSLNHLIEIRKTGKDEYFINYVRNTMYT